MPFVACLAILIGAHGTASARGRFQGLPQVLQGGQLTLSATSYTPTTGTVGSWTILDPSGNTVASIKSPNGWGFESFSSSSNWSFLFTASSTATVESGYTIECVLPTIGGSGDSLYKAQFAVIAALTAPTNLTADPQNQEVVLSWAAVSSATGYNIYISKTSGGPYLLSGSTTYSAGDVKNLTDGTPYYFVVTATYTSGGNNDESGYSSQVTATPEDFTPSAPVITSVIPGNTQVALTYTPSTNPPNYPPSWSSTINYVAFYSTSSAGPWTDAPGYYQTGNTLVVNGLTNGVTYYFFVEATNSNSDSANSSVVSASPLVAGPSAPTNLVATGGYQKVSLSWNASPGATEYQLYLSSYDGGFYILQDGIQSTSWTYSGLAASPDTYYFEVSAMNSTGVSGFSNVASATTLSSPPPPPPAPTNLVAYPANASVNLVWQPVSAATSYSVLMSETSGGPYQQVATSTSPSCAVASLQNGVTYCFVVEGVNSGGNSPNSNQAQATPYAGRIPMGIIPNPPTGYLPDALALPDWEDQAIPKDSSDAPGGGPSSIFSVSEPFGELDVSSGSDIVMDDPIVGQISFDRQYRVALAAGNISSPGLPPGWTHNYDYRIYPQQTGVWGPIQLVYPNGASETLVPEMTTNSSGQTVPSGTIQVPPNAPYAASGVASSSSVGLWTSISLTRNGSEQDVFTMAAGDSAYRLTSIVNNAGSQTNLTYAQGELTSISSSSASGTYTGPTKSIGLTYSGGLLSAVTATGSGQVNYAYNSNGQLASVTNVDDGKFLWTYAYTPVNGVAYLCSSATEGSAGSANIAFNSQTGQVTSLTDANSKSHTYSYTGLPVGGSSASTTIQVGSGVDNHTDTVDGLGRISKTTNAAGNSTTFGWLGGEIGSLVLPSTQGYTITRDIVGNPTTVTDLAKCVTTLTWNYPAGYPFGQLASVQVTGNDGTKMAPTTYQYFTASGSGQIAGYVSSVTYPSGQVVNYKYTPLGQLLSATTTAANGSTVSASLGYSSPNGEVLGEPTLITDPLQHSTSITYTGDLSYQFTDPLKISSSATVNANRQPVSIVTPDSLTTTLTYVAPSKGIVSATTSGAGLEPQTLFSLNYDSEYGETGAQQDPLQAVVTSVDTQYDLATLVNGNSIQMYTLSWDPFTQVESETIGAYSHSSGSLYTTSLNDDGFPTSFTGPSYTGTVTPLLGDVPGEITWSSATYGGAYKSYVYDGFNRVVSDGTSAGPGHNYTYDNAGRLTGQDNLLTYSYAPNGARTSMTVSASGASYVYTYTYDNADRVTNIAVNFQGTVSNVSYAYDADDRVTSVQTPYVTTLYAYDADGRVTQLQNLTPAGLIDDSASQFTGLDNSQHSVFSAFGGSSLSSPMTFDINSNLSGFTYFVRASDYQVDPAGFNYWNGVVKYGFAGLALTSETWSGSFAGTLKYALDHGENLSTLRNEQFTTATATDRLTSSTTTFKNAIQYDAMGDMTGFRNLTAQFSLDGSMPQLNSVAYQYDVDGRLSTDGSTGADGGSFVYDGDNLVAHNSSVYVWGPTGPVLEIDENNLECFTYDPSGSLVSRIGLSIPGGSLPTGQSGSTHFTVDGPILYDAYGLPANGGQNSPGTQSDRFGYYCPFQYKGQAGYISLGFDQSTQTPLLINCQHRWYDPLSGRWVSRDPAGLEGGENGYEFCAGNPLRNVDPAGLWEFTWQGYWDELQGYGRGTLAGGKHFLQGLWSASVPGRLTQTDWRAYFSDPIGAERKRYQGMWQGLKDAGNNLAGNNGSEGFADTFTQLLLTVASAKAAGGGSQCLVAGTRVLLADGTSERIEDIKPGDWVQTRSGLGSNLGNTESKPVVQVFKHLHQGTVRISFATGGSVEATTGHPFYVISKGFVAAAELQVGDDVAGFESGHSDKVIGKEFVSRSQNVYNLDVSDDHTYFVQSSDGSWLWTHNQAPCSYELVATRDGFYPVMKRGFAEPQGGEFLNIGDVWKFGETINPATRYSQRFLDGWGLVMRETAQSSKAAAILAQRANIDAYILKYLRLPFGNKIRF